MTDNSSHYYKAMVPKLSLVIDQFVVVIYLISNTS